MPSWSRPAKYITGSASVMKHDTPVPEQTGFSESDPNLPFIIDPPLMLGLLSSSEPELPVCMPRKTASKEGLDIAASITVSKFADRRARIIEGSAEATDNDARGDLGTPGLVDLVELAAEVVELELLEEVARKNEPSTLFAVSREASFLSCRRNLERCFGGRGGGRGRRSKGTKPAGRRVICIECGRRCRGRHGGVGSVGASELKAYRAGGV